MSERLATVRRLVANGALSEAETVLGAILADDRGCLEGWDWLGFVLYGLRRPSEAEAACRRALEIRPDHAYALKGLGLCLAAQGQVDEGVAHLQRAIGRRPDWVDPRWDLVVTLLSAGRLAEAAAALSSARAALPDPRWDRLARQLERAHPQT